jgi:hypothetical protein
MARIPRTSGLNVVVEPTKRERLSAAQFKQLLSDRPHSVQRSRFVPPVFGQPGFGEFEVEYFVPVLKRLKLA